MYCHCYCNTVVARLQAVGQIRCPLTPAQWTVLTTLPGILCEATTTAPKSHYGQPLLGSVAPAGCAPRVLGRHGWPWQLLGMSLHYSSPIASHTITSEMISYKLYLNANCLFLTWRSHSLQYLPKQTKRKRKCFFTITKMRRLYRNRTTKIPTVLTGQMNTLNAFISLTAVQKLLNPSLLSQWAHPFLLTQL